MSVYAVQNKDSLPVGDLWVIAASVRDLDGELTDLATPVVTITLPNGSTATPTVERRDTGIYRTSYTVASEGRYVGSVAAAGYGTATVAAYASANTTSMPTLATTKTYLKIDADDTSQDAEVADALAAEAAAQRSVCRVSAVYPADLREALHRRVARNLALRGIPLAVLRGDAESGNTVLPGNDPEVRRLERPHRKVVLA